MNELIKLGLAIKAVRNLKGLSMRQLADQADLSPSTISLLEIGQRDATFSTITSICKALDIKPSFLVDLASSLDDELLKKAEEWRKQIREKKEGLDKLSLSLNQKAFKLIKRR